MAAWRRAIELSLGDADVEKLRSIAQSRTEPASRVERSRILLGYWKDSSFFAVGQALGLHHQTVQRCVERAVAEGPMAALDDRPRSGREPAITVEAKTWVTSLACRKAKDLGYPHELWTTRLLARHARAHGPAEGHACALGHKACRDDRSVLYQRVPRLFEALAMANGDGRYGRLLKTLARVELLILDDWGLATLTQDQGRDLLEIIDDRHNRGSTIVTSQLPVDHWHEVIANPTVADAILDRLVHNAHRLTLNGDSMRKAAARTVRA